MWLSPSIPNTLRMLIGDSLLHLNAVSGNFLMCTCPVSVWLNRQYLYMCLQKVTVTYFFHPHSSSKTSLDTSSSKLVLDWNLNWIETHRIINCKWALEITKLICNAYNTYSLVEMETSVKKSLTSFNRIKFIFFWSIAESRGQNCGLSHAVKDTSTMPSNIDQMEASMVDRRITHKCSIQTSDDALPYDFAWQGSILNTPRAFQSSAKLHKINVCLSGPVSWHLHTILNLISAK